MDRLEYGDLVEPWKVKLIVSRARRMGFRGAELADVQQEIVLDLSRFRYDADRSNGAKEATALTALIDNRLKKIRRSDDRYRDHLQRLGEQANLSAEIHIDGDAVIDVQCAVSALPRKERAVCRELMCGASKPEIAVTLRCGWHTVERLVRNIRNRFLELGLDVYARPKTKV